MKNYQIKGEDGKMYWIHRAIGVSVFVFREDHERNRYILAGKRGTGMEDHQGLWNAICGYLDFDETLKEAAVREVKEETNLIIFPEDLVEFEINDSPSAFKQNVSHRFFTVLFDEFDDINISIGTEGEVNEVAEVKWIPLDEIDNYEWAFEHLSTIHSLIVTLNSFYNDESDNI